MEQSTTPTPVRLVTGEPPPPPAPVTSVEFPTSLVLSLAAVMLAWGLCVLVVRHDRRRQPEEHALRALALRWRLPPGATRALRTLAAHSGVSPTALLLSPAALHAAWRPGLLPAANRARVEAALGRLRGVGPRAPDQVRAPAPSRLGPGAS
jgi:hypothetical protein